jgi:hypothetical protein
VSLLSAGGASAQAVIIDQNGVRVAPPMPDRVPPPPAAHWDNGGDYAPGYDRGYQRGAYDQGIGPREARRIARAAGMVQAWGVDRRGPVWVVEGSDRRGRALRVVVSARSGDIVNVDRAGRS